MRSDKIYDFLTKFIKWHFYKLQKKNQTSSDSNKKKIDWQKSITSKLFFVSESFMTNKNIGTDTW